MNENFLWILSFLTVSVILHPDAESMRARVENSRKGESSQTLTPGLRIESRVTCTSSSSGAIKKSLYRRVGDTDSLWCKVWRELFAYLFECVFTKAANRANPIFRNIFKRSAGSDATIGITYCGVVNPFTCCANVLFHISLFL